MPEGKHALYRFYNTGGVLLYVGITMDVPRRMNQHGKSKDWFDKVSGIKIEWHPDRLAVLKAEALAIEVERPMFNIQHPPLPEPRTMASEHAEMYLQGLRAMYCLMRDGHIDNAMAWIDGMWSMEKRFSLYETDDDGAEAFAQSIAAGNHILPVELDAP